MQTVQTVQTVTLSSLLDSVGCSLTLQVHGEGVYAECQIEVPTDVAHGHAHQLMGLRASSTTGSQTSSQSSQGNPCSLQEGTLMAYLRPHTALYECAAEHYFAHSSGRCEHCHAELATEHVQFTHSRAISKAARMPSLGYRTGVCELHVRKRVGGRREGALSRKQARRGMPLGLQQWVSL